MEKLQLTDEVEKLDLSVRAYNCLKNAGCHTLHDVMSLGKDNLINVKNLGNLYVQEVVVAMSKAGFDIPEKGDKNLKSRKPTIKYLSDLKKVGIGFLKTLDPRKFMKDSSAMDEISTAVEAYLNFYVKKALEDKSENKLTRKQIEENVEGFIDSFKGIVDLKREKLNEEENNRKFVASMKSKIGEVRKYKHKKFEHKEGHDKNPYVSENELGV